MCLHKALKSKSRLGSARSSTDMKQDVAGKGSRESTMAGSDNAENTSYISVELATQGAGGSNRMTLLIIALSLARIHWQLRCSLSRQKLIIIFQFSGVSSRKDFRVVYKWIHNCSSKERSFIYYINRSRVTGEQEQRGQRSEAWRALGILRILGNPGTGRFVLV